MSTVQRVSITTVMGLVLGTVRASASELPKYEVAGFPISAVQISILESSALQEQSPTRPVTLAGMPAFRERIEVIGKSPNKEAAR
jgi:hypothetical protein